MTFFEKQPTRKAFPGRRGLRGALAFWGLEAGYPARPALQLHGIAMQMSGFPAQIQMTAVSIHRPRPPDFGVATNSHYDFLTHYSYHFQLT